MSAVDTIRRVLAAKLLSRDMTTVPARGASPSELERLEHAIGRPLTTPHRELLRAWNGIDLDVIRIYGIGDVTPGVRDLLREQTQVGASHPLLVIGSDPAGFIYLEDRGGHVFQLDSDGGVSKQVASDLDDFVDRLIFGKDAASFAGQEWKDELTKAGVLEP